MLEARGLIKHLGGRRVVDGVDLVCLPGQIHGLLGPNGAGKTTTLRMLYGFLTPDGGEIRFEGADVREDLEAAKRHIGVCTQDDTFDGDFTVEQNLLVAAEYFRPRPTGLRARVDHLLDRFELRPYARQRPETLSGGYRRRLMLARAIVHSPRLLFLDEPTTGLDPQARVAVWQLVDGLRSDGLAIVLTTHYMDEAERLSDVLTVLARG
jgi:lipooligosaccharide transport system ATP-binding protein